MSSLLKIVFFISGSFKQRTEIFLLSSAYQKHIEQLRVLLCICRLRQTSWCSVALQILQYVLWKRCCQICFEDVVSYFICHTPLTFLAPQHPNFTYCIITPHRNMTNAIKLISTVVVVYVCVMYLPRWAHFSCLWRVTVKPTTGCGASRRNLCPRTSGSSCSGSLRGWWCWTMSSETQVRAESACI